MWWLSLTFKLSKMVRLIKIIRADRIMVPSHPCGYLSSFAKSLKISLSLELLCPWLVSGDNLWYFGLYSPRLASNSEAYFESYYESETGFVRSLTSKVTLREILSMLACKLYKTISVLNDSFTDFGTVRYSSWMFEF